MNYIRFQTTQINELSTKPAGVFQIVYDTLDSWLPQYQYDYINWLVSWFNQYLKKPGKFSRKKTNSEHTRGISRFKESAKEHIAKMYELKIALEEHDVYIEVLITDTPWYIVYEDKIQIVAEPYKETM